MEEKKNRYPSVEPKPDFAQIEQAILDFWEKHRVFERSVAQRPGGNNEYVFYDGPPFANGLPHYGHLLTGYVKDVIPRYQTMRGRRVERRFGWDCHGLPAEMEVEKELGLQGRKSVQDFGVARFNDFCRESVMRYTAEWERYVGRQARWVDFHNDYKTMDLDYMESVIWAFKQLWDKGLIYEAYRVMPYSWGAQTPLSNFEIRLDDATRSRQDPAVTVAFRLTPQSGDSGPVNLLAWTTTPWTLPSNLALAVHPEVDYDIWECPGLESQGAAAGEGRSAEQFVFAAPLAEKVLKSAGLDGGTSLADGTTPSDGAAPTDHAARRIGTVKGASLVGRSYEPLFDYFAGADNAHQVLAADFIDTAEGTGIVHMAPGFGEDDQSVCEAAGIEVVVPVDDEGNFTDQISPWSGRNVFDANRDIIAELRHRGLLWSHQTIEHNYPYCWRTDTPIIYRAMNSWYVDVTSIKDRLVELNQQINWIPSHVRDGRFGNWLQGARDWSISRNRFWGAPLPVWRSDDPEHPRVDVYGSLAELEADFGVRPQSLHRPDIDQLTRPNPDDPSGRSVMRRVPEVLDCWFESGSMPFAQVHYPFDNKDWFDSHFPADFIVEYINQTRGWFYTLHVLGVALFDSPPFKNAIGHGVVLAEDGSKLSKRLRNYSDPEEMFSQQGSDALRWYLMSSPVVRGGDLRISQSDMTSVARLVLYPIWNAYSFFCLYANADGIQAEHNTGSDHVLDRYIMAKTRQLAVDVTSALDDYDLPQGCAHITEFIDALNNWYVRRSRDRFWAPKEDRTPEAVQSKQQAYDTLFVVLTTFAKLMAPLLPLISEEIYRGLVAGGDAGPNGDAPNGDTDSPASVHLSDWPEPDSLPHDQDLVAAMDHAREVCSSVLHLREQAKIPVRIPLSHLSIAGPRAQTLRPYVELLADEINVKAVELDDEAPEGFAPSLKPDAKLLGPRLKEQMQAVMAAAKSGDWKMADRGRAEVAGVVLEPDEFTVTLAAADADSSSQIVNAVLDDGLTVVSLDMEVTDELLQEGQARRLVRLIQQARRDMGLHISDRIELSLALPGELEQAISRHQDYLADQVLATSVDFTPEADLPVTESELDGQPISFAIRKA